MNFLVLNHIPVRKTSKLLKEEAEAELRASCGRQAANLTRLKVPTGSSSKEDKVAFHLNEAKKLMFLEDMDDFPENIDKTATDNFQLDKAKALEFRPSSFSKRMGQQALPANATPKFLVCL